jgi:hypothetical protein
VEAGEKGVEETKESEARLYRDYKAETVITVERSGRGIGWCPGESSEVGGEDADEE